MEIMQNKLHIIYWCLKIVSIWVHVPDVDNGDDDGGSFMNNGSAEKVEKWSSTHKLPKITKTHTHDYRNVSCLVWEQENIEEKGDKQCNRTNRM